MKPVEPTFRRDVIGTEAKGTWRTIRSPIGAAIRVVERSVNWSPAFESPQRSQGPSSADGGCIFSGVTGNRAANRVFASGPDCSATFMDAALSVYTRSSRTLRQVHAHIRSDHDATGSICAY